VSNSSFMMLTIDHQYVV